MRSEAGQIVAHLEAQSDAADADFPTGADVRRDVMRRVDWEVAMVVASRAGAAAGEGAEVHSTARCQRSHTGFSPEVARALPTDMEVAPDGRVFVAQKYGQLRVIQNGVLLPTPFLSVTPNGNGERGLIGVTLDPAFSTNGYVYVHYTTADLPIHNRVSRFTANPSR